MKKYFFITILISTFIIFLLGNFCLAQEGVPSSSRAPESLEEVASLIKRIIRGFPEAMKGVWREAADWFKGLWNSYIFPWLQGIWHKILGFLGKEVEKRKPEIEEEFEKEKEEMREEIPKAGKTLWQRFKELIK